MAQNTAPPIERKPFERHALTTDQEADLRQQLLTQRLTQLEAEHVQAQFAVEQIEKAIEAARAAVAALEPTAAE